MGGTTCHHTFLISNMTQDLDSVFLIPVFFYYESYLRFSFLFDFLFKNKIKQK